MATRASFSIVDEAAPALGVHGPVSCIGRCFLDSPLPVSELATGVFAALALTVSRLLSRLGLPGAEEAEADRALSDTWFGLHVRAKGWQPPSPWDPLSGSFATADGSWIRTHANAPRHRAALLRVLGCEPDAPRTTVAQAISSWPALGLESAIAEAGGAAAALRSPGQWSASPAGMSLATEPLIAARAGEAWHGVTHWAPTARRPLSGIRVLDLTRVIAGPACTQVLAGLGAQVLRIDPPGWDEPSVLPLVMWNKRSARLDARTPAGSERLRQLLAGADVLVHGYRAGAVDHLGLASLERHRLRPGLIEVSERAYGWSGPWTRRRGFDSLVQFATGIAHRGMTSTGAEEPVSLPVQALDWATGYLAAAAAIAGVVRRLETNRGSTWNLSLARTALSLLAMPCSTGTANPATTAPPGEEGQIVATALGDAALAPSPFHVGPAALDYDRVTTRLGPDEAMWR